MASPHRIFTGTELVLASHNAGKLREISSLFEGRPFQVTSAADHDVPEPEETEHSFIGNAVLKARHTVKATGKPAIADDSGLVVPALNGAPGIYSARWAGRDRDFIMAMQKVNSSLAATGSEPAIREHGEEQDHEEEVRQVVAVALGLHRWLQVIELEEISNKSQDLHLKQAKGVTRA